MQFEDFAGELDSPGAGAYALFTGDLDPVGRGVVNPPMAADLPRRAAAMPLPAGYLLFNGELDRAPDERVNAGAGRGTADDPRSLLRKQAPVPQKSLPTSPSSVPERSWGEALSDTSKSLAQGLLDVGSLPGVAYSAFTGDYDTAYLNAIRGTQEVLQDGKSPAMQAHAQALQKKLSTAEGWREKLAVAGWETLTDPALLGDAVARSGPGMLAGGLFGRAAGSAVDAAGNALLGRTIATGSEAAARSAVALKNAAPVVASGSAVGVSAAQQGASVANELYAELQKLPTSAFAAEPEFQQLAREHGEDKARSILAAAAANRALLVGTGASVLSMKLVPGGDAIEKMFLPSHLKGTAREAVKSTSFMTRPLTRGMEGSLGSQALEVLVRRARSAGTESFSEGAEEASGAVAKGLELSRAGQDVKLDEMAGEAAGQGMAVGGVMGGTAGARGAGAAPRVLEQPTRPTVPPELPTARGQSGTQPHTAGGPASPPPPSPPSPSADLSAAPIEHSYAYSGGMLPGSGATWSEVAAADRKAQAEAEILRQAEADALPAQDAPTDADAGQAAPSTAASTSADADPSVAQAEEQGAARHTAAAQVSMQVQALDSGMLVVRGDQAAIQSRLQAGGVGGARSFSGVTVVPVEQAALARRVLSAPPVESAHRQVGGVPARALTAANAAQEAASLQGAQQAPAVHRGEPAASGTFAGARTAGTSAAGLAAPLAVQGQQAGAQASAADVRALPPAPVQMEPLRDGTLMVRGDAKLIRARLLAGGVDRVIERKGGLVVGLGQVDKARQLLAATPQPEAASAAPASGYGQADARTLEKARILQGAPVAVLKGNEAPHGYPLLRDWAVRLFQAFGGKATNREIGEVVLDERSVRDSMAHRMNPYKAVAFAAARQVVEHGALVLSAQHSRDTTGHFISAPVDIGGVENIVTVLVRTTPNSQRMYLHSAITKEGLLKSGNSGADTASGMERPGKATSGDVASVLRRLLTVNVEAPTASISATAPRDAAPRFSTRSDTSAQSLSLEQVQQLVQQALSGLRNPPPVDVVLRAADLGIVAPEGAMGVWTGNRLAIVVENHRQVVQVRETVFHELFHAGLRNILPRRDYVQAMLDLAKRDARVQQYAMDWKKDAPEAPMQLQALRDAGWTGSELTAQYEALAIEEGLAVVAEELRGRMQAGLRLGPQVRVLASWLASVADRMGMGQLAQSIRAMTYNEAERFVMRAIDHAGATGGEVTSTGQTRFSTLSAQDPQADLQAGAGNAPAPVQMEPLRDGTLMVRGDAKLIRARLLAGGVDRVIERKGGLVVGLGQVDKARKVLLAAAQPQSSTRPSRQGQQFSRSAPPAPDQASQAATVASVRAAVAKLTNSMGLLAGGRGRVVATTSDEIKAHWEPLIGEVDMGSQDTGLAHGFYDPETKTVFLIADHIEAGQEMAVAAHELMHKHGKAVLGEAGWRQLHEVISTWAGKPDGSLERQVYDEAVRRVDASRPAGADAASYSSEELFPYAVQVAMELGVEATAMRPITSVQGWLARVRALLRAVLGKLTGNPQAFDGQDLVDLAFAVAQREISRHPFATSNTEVEEEIAGTSATSEAETAVLQFSRSPGTKATFEARIDALFAGDKPRGIHRGEQAAVVLDRSDMLEFLKITNGPVYLDETAVGKPDRGLPRGSPAKHPNMTAEQWKNVPQWLETPAAVFDSDTVTGDLVLIAPELVNGAIVMMTINPKAQGNRPGVTVGLLTNAYDKDGGPPPVGKWAREGKAWYIDKKVFPDVLRRVGVQSSDAFQNKPGTRRILTDKQFGGWKKENRSDF